MLLPSEQEAMLKALEAAKVPMKPLKMNPSKQQPITGALQALLSKDSALKVWDPFHALGSQPYGSGLAQARC